MTSFNLRSVSSYFQKWGKPEGGITKPIALRFAVVMLIAAYVFLQLRTAWVCDDAQGKSAEARSCREMAIREFSSQLPHQDTENGITGAGVHVDMLRRVGNFRESAGLIETLLDYQSLNDVIRAVLEFQRDKCAEEDVECYTIGDAYGG